MLKALRALLALPAILFIMIAVSWLVNPTSAAAQLGMELLDGVGRSSQIGDLAAFFMTLGICILMGLISGNRTWFYPAILLLGTAALSRVLAWLAHDAALTIDMIAVEATVAILLLVASRKLSAEST